MKDWTEMGPGAFDAAAATPPLDLPAAPGADLLALLEAETVMAAPAPRDNQDWTAADLPIAVRLARESLARPEPDSTAGDLFGAGGWMAYAIQLRVSLANLADAAEDSLR